MKGLSIKVLQFLILLGFLWIAAYGAFSISTLSQTPKNTQASSDAIIVLTGGHYRLKTGFDMWAQKYAPHLFITGVHPSVSMSTLIKDWKKTNKGALTLPRCCAAIGQRATTTIQNAQEAAAWIATMQRAGIKINNIHLVTSTYHMPRAVLEFQHFMPDIKMIPRPVTQQDYRPNEKRFWWITASEFNKIIFRKLTFFTQDIKRALLAPITKKR